MKKPREKADLHIIQNKKRKLLDHDRLIQKKQSIELKRKVTLRLLLNRLKSTNLFLTVKDIPIVNFKDKSEGEVTNSKKKHKSKRSSKTADKTNNDHKCREEVPLCKGIKAIKNDLREDIQKLSLNVTESPSTKVAKSSSKKRTAKKELKSLGPAELKKVEEVLNCRTQVNIEGFNMTIRQEDILRLRDEQWLNDELVNFYGALIMERAKIQPDKYPSVHVFNTYFYPLLTEHGYPKVQRWTRKVDLFSKELVIIPIHLGVHWCCAIINNKLKRFEYYDPLLSSNSRCLKALRNYLKEEAKSKKILDFDLSKWANYTPKKIPSQENGYDCGVFSCQYAEYASRHSPFTFSHRHMLRLR
ncbi:hypothetical protein K7432_011302, partial [Basidiobolus ranarum]